MTSALLDVQDRAETAGPAGDEPHFARHDDDYADVGTLCRTLQATTPAARRQRLRSRIIVRCLPLADHIAHRFVGRGETADDLTQVARLGLVKAVDRYDPDRGPFLAYAVPTIMGDVRRHFRDHAWGVYVPRKVKDTHQRMRAAIGPLAQRLGRAPTARELAAELGVDKDDVVQSVHATYAYRPHSLDAPSTDGDSERPTADRHGAEDPRYGAVEDALTVAGLVSGLTDRERLLLRLRFCDGLPQTQIGQRLGVSQVQVSRLLAATLERLRQRFEDGAAMDSAGDPTA